MCTWKYVVLVHPQRQPSWTQECRTMHQSTQQHSIPRMFQTKHIILQTRQAIVYSWKPIQHVTVMFLKRATIAACVDLGEDIRSFRNWKRRLECIATSICAAIRVLPCLFCCSHRCATPTPDEATRGALLTRGGDESDRGKGRHHHTASLTVFNTSSTDGCGYWKFYPHHPLGFRSPSFHAFASSLFPCICIILVERLEQAGVCPDPKLLEKAAPVLKASSYHGCFQSGRFSRLPGTVRASEIFFKEASVEIMVSEGKLTSAEPWAILTPREDLLNDVPLNVRLPVGQNSAVCH